MDPVTGRLLEGERLKIDETIRSIVGEGPVALVGFPNHGNPGDQAIWLGAEVTLRRLGIPVGYRASYLGFNCAAMRAAIGERPVLLNGGGNFGDLYRGQQQVRERVLAECHGNPVVQLPQSIHFQDHSNLERVRRLIGSHGAVTILCREAVSTQFAARQFDADVQLCPDLSLAMGNLPRRPLQEINHDIVWITRADAESSWTPPDVAGVLVVDWARPGDGSKRWPPGRRRTWEWVSRGTAAMEREVRVARWLWRPVTPGFRRLAEAWVAQAAKILVLAPVIVTERLHGHLLSLMADVPHVVLDGGYGKMGAVLDGPTGASPLVHRAWSIKEALERANALAEECRQ